MSASLACSSTHLTHRCRHVAPNLAVSLLSSLPCSFYIPSVCLLADVYLHTNIRPQSVKQEIMLSFRTCGLHCSVQDSTVMCGSSHRLPRKSRHGSVPIKLYVQKVGLDKIWQTVSKLLLQKENNAEKRSYLPEAHGNACHSLELTGFAFGGQPQTSTHQHLHLAFSLG